MESGSGMLQKEPRQSSQALEVNDVESHMFLFGSGGLMELICKTVLKMSVPVWYFPEERIPCTLKESLPLTAN